MPARLQRLQTALLIPALLLLGLAWLAAPALAAPPDKIEICHIPPLTPDNVQTIRVGGEGRV